MIVLFIFAGALLLHAGLAERDKDTCQARNWLNRHKGEYDLTWY